MNNMGKGFGIVIAGIIIAATGAAIAAFSAKQAYDDYKKMDKFKEEHNVKISDSSKIKVEVGSGTINIHHSTETYSYYDYKVYDFYNVKYDAEENELKLTKKWQYWFVWFDSISNKSVLDLYLTEQDYDAYFEVSAGRMNLDGDYNFSSLTVSVSAGKFNSNGNLTADDVNLKISAGDLVSTGKIIANNEATLKVSAGDMNVSYVEAKEANIKISAGNMDAKVKSDKIDFRVSAGDINLTIVGSLSDYKTDIDKSAGDCNLTKEQRHRDSGTKELTGNISAGDATIEFVAS